MMVLIKWSPEMGVYSVAVPGRMDRVIMPEDLEDGKPLAPCRPAFLEARAAVESGRAVAGVHVDV